MNKFYLFLISIIYALAAYGETISHSVSINPEDVAWTDTIISGVSYVIPEIQNLENQAEYGQPSLPRIFVSFALPPDATNIAISDIATQKHSTKLLKSPVMPFLSEIASSQKNETYTFDALSHKDNSKAEKIIEISYVENFKDINLIVSVCLTPIQYNQAKSIAEIYSTFNFSITFNTDYPVIQSHSQISKDREYSQNVSFLKSIVANPDNVGNAEDGFHFLKKPIIFDHRIGFKAKKEDSYYPLLEEGKEWRYTMYNGVNKTFPDYRPGPVEVNRVIRLENPVEIDGEVYLQANAYYDDEHQDDSLNPIAYLREDTDAKQVIMKINDRNIYYYDYFTKSMYHELRDGILYDFKEPLNGYFAELCVLSESNQFECLDGMHNNHRLSYLHPDGIEFEMVEGIGYLRLSDEYNSKCDLFGLAYSNIPSLPDWCYYPYLYEVAKADGTVIYRNPDYAPGWSSAASVISDGEITVNMDGDRIHIRCTNDDAEVRLYNMQGMIVAHAVCAAGEAYLPTSGMESGVYVLQCEGYIQKVSIK